MAFSFGNPSPAAAAAPAFGAPAAPAFGAAAAPAPGGFGAAPAAFGAAPATPAFGSPAGGSLFGNAAPAPTAGFGAAPKPGGLFGSPAAPAGGLFGSAPAPAAGGLFGSTPAPAQGGLFGATPAVPGQQPPLPSLSSQSSYSQLPPQVKQAIDNIHEQMMKHKRSMAQVQTMAPVLLRKPTQPADAAAGATSPLVEQMQAMRGKLQEIESNLQACGREAMRVKSKYEQTTTQSVVYGIWPIEALASRKGVKLTTLEAKPNPTVTDQIRKSLELQAAHVDRLEKIPSPYMWQALEEMEVKLHELTNTTQMVSTQLTQMRNVRDMGVASVVQSQTDLLLQVAQQIKLLQHRMQDLRTKYRTWERETNVLDQQKMRDLQAQQKRDEKVKIGYLKAAVATQPPAPSAPAGYGAAAPQPGGMFGAKPAAAGGLFGGTPAPGGFGAAPKPAGGGLFGSAQAPAGGGLFGAAPAPVAPGGFGAAPPPPALGAAPAFGAALGAAPAFGAAPGAAPAFGAAPAPAFGAAPAPAFGAAPAPTSSSASKPKNKSRSSRRK